MAGRVFPLVIPPDPGPASPFVVNDQGDLHVVESLEDPGVESYDALDFEYFDTQGKKLTATVVKRRVSLHLDVDAQPEPERLLGLIHAYVEAVISRGDFGRPTAHSLKRFNRHPHCANQSLLWDASSTSNSRTGSLVGSQDGSIHRTRFQGTLTVVGGGAPRCHWVVVTLI